MGKIWVSGVGFEIGYPVVRWDEGPGYDAHQNRCINPSHACRSGIFPFSKKKPVNRAHRFSARPQLRKFKMMPPLAATQGVVRQFIVHHDGVPSAASCFDVLHNERGLSCHFLLDNNGTIYQTLDIAFMGYHAAGFNAGSVGIEISNRGDAKRDPNFYSKRKMKREVVTCKISDHIYLAFDFTPEQYEAMRYLTRGLAKALPNMPIDYPQSSPGYAAWTEIAGAKSYAGLMGHYHTTRRKWDPGPFDFKVFCESIRGRLSFPMRVRGDNPEVPDDDVDRAEDVAALFAINERKSDAYFPIGGADGESRLWHGGLHLAGKKEQELYAPFPGRLIAARTGSPDSAVGSTNFVLLRHSIRVGEDALTFFVLYFHLADEWGREPGKGAPKWLESDDWKRKKRRGSTILLDETVEAGDLVGRMGTAGPADRRRAQAHFEIFATEDIAAKAKLAGYTFIDGTADGRFATAKELIDEIDKDKDGQLSRRELVSFFGTSSDSRLARFYTTLHVSEWTRNPDWTDELARAPEFRGKRKSEIRELVQDQIDPTLWWDDALAIHAKLPKDGVVYHFNPIALIGSINDALQAAKTLEANGKNAFDASLAQVQPDDVKGDIDDEEGESFLDASEIEAVDLGKDLTLEDLAAGFPE